MAELVARAAGRVVSDWGIGPLLVGPLGSDSRLDLARFRRDLSVNVLATAARGGGTDLDVVFKQANLRPETHAGLVEMWGQPERTIFCLRDPASFMASAIRKFPNVDLDNQRDHSYLGTIRAYEQIGGDVFVYGPHVSADDYRRFLVPLDPPVGADEICYRGASAPELTTPAMHEQYERVRHG